MLTKRYIMNDNVTVGKLIRVCKENNLFIIFKGSTQACSTEIEINPQERSVQIDEKTVLIYSGLITTQQVVDAFKKQGFSMYAVIGSDEDALEDDILVISYNSMGLRYISCYGNTDEIISYFKENNIIRGN